VYAELPETQPKETAEPHMSVPRAPRSKLSHLINLAQRAEGGPTRSTHEGWGRGNGGDIMDGWFSQGAADFPKYIGDGAVLLNVSKQGSLQPGWSCCTRVGDDRGKPEGISFEGIWTYSKPLHRSREELESAWQEIA